MKCSPPRRLAAMPPRDMLLLRKYLWTAVGECPEPPQGAPLDGISEPVAFSTADPRRALLHRGRLFEGITLAWNAVGIVVLAIAAIRARSVALAGFGLDSLIEIG